MTNGLIYGPSAFFFMSWLQEKRPSKLKMKTSHTIRSWTVSASFRAIFREDSKKLWGRFLTKILKEDPIWSKLKEKAGLRSTRALGGTSPETFGQPGRKSHDASNIIWVAHLNNEKNQYQSFLLTAGLFNCSLPRLRLEFPNFLLLLRLFRFYFEEFVFFFFLLKARQYESFPLLWELSASRGRFLDEPRADHLPRLGVRGSK